MKLKLEHENQSWTKRNDRLWGVNCTTKHDLNLCTRWAANYLQQLIYFHVPVHCFRCMKTSNLTSYLSMAKFIRKWAEYQYFQIEAKIDRVHYEKYVSLILICYKNVISNINKHVSVSLQIISETINIFLYIPVSSNLVELADLVLPNNYSYDHASSFLWFCGIMDPEKYIFIHINYYKLLTQLSLYHSHNFHWNILQDY